METDKTFGPLKPKHSGFIIMSCTLLIIAVFIVFISNVCLGSLILLISAFFLISLVLYIPRSIKYTLTQDALICTKLFSLMKFYYKDISSVEKYNPPTPGLFGYRIDETAQKYVSELNMPDAIKYQLGGTRGMYKIILPVKEGKKRFLFNIDIYTDNHGILIKMKNGDVVFVTPSDTDAFISEIKNRL